MPSLSAGVVMSGAKRGQYVLVGALLLSSVVMVSTLVLYKSTMTKPALAYRAVKENILSITSDLDRALAHSLSLASQEYYLTGSRETARAQGRAFLSTWIRSVLVAYSNLGLEMGIEPLEEGYTDVAFVLDWNEDRGLSYVSSRFRLNVTGYGFTGWVGDRIKATMLTLDENSITSNATSGSSTVSFTITEEMDGVVPNLAAEDVSITVHASGSIWLPANTTALEYLGDGNYTATFSPQVNEWSRGVILTVMTPEDSVIVRAQTSEYADVRVFSLEEGGSGHDEGQAQLGDCFFSTLPNMTRTYRGQYLAQYHPASERHFVNWTTAGNVYVLNASSPLTTVTVKGDGNLTAYYANGMGPGGEPSGSAEIFLTSAEFTCASVNLGSIGFEGVDYTLPNSTYQALGFHPVDYTPLDGSIFLYWQTAGDIMVENGTSVSTRVFVNGNGTVKAVYLGGEAASPPSSHPWDLLCVERDAALAPSYAWTGDDGKLSPTFSTGEGKQALNMSSPVTPQLLIAEQVNVTCVVRPNPPSSTRDITLQLGFISNGTYYLLGQGTFPIAGEGSYRMSLNVTSGQYPGEPRVIPENSTIVLTVTVSFQPKPPGSFFLYHGMTWPSSIELGGVPIDG